MKKILSLVLCIVLVGCMLVSCGEEAIGGYLDNYDYTPPVIEKVTLDMYIIGDSSNSENAIVTVERYINQYTEDKFNTTVNMNYIDASEYDEKVMAAVKATGDAKADIVLINSVELMNQLCPLPGEDGSVATNYLADLTELLATNKFGQLNTAIASTLLEGSKRDGKYYCVPNNHVIGQYEYVIINKSVARDTYNFSPATLNTFVSLEAAAPLIQTLKDAGKTDTEIESVIKIVTGHQNYGEAMSEL